MNTEKEQPTAGPQLIQELISWTKQALTCLANNDFDPDELTDIDTKRQAIFCQLQALAAAGNLEDAVTKRLLKELGECQDQLLALAQQQQATLTEHISDGQAERQGLQAYVPAPLPGSKLDISGI